MSEKMRLDKYLADMGYGTRSRVKELISEGRVSVNGAAVKTCGFKVDSESDSVAVEGVLAEYRAFEYYMLNKPAGTVSASEDKKDITVLSLIKDRSRKDMFPVGRLDKDTEGLLLITNDGELAHRLLSPKKHVDKIYYVETDKALLPNEGEMLREGVDIGEAKPTLPAKLVFLNASGINAYLLTINEGKFHQVKRMFKVFGINVLYLKRIAMGPLRLDEKLAPGQYRRLTKEETDSLKNL